MNNSLSFISKRGIKPILVLTVLTIISILFCDFLGDLFVILTLFSIYVFRDTKRYIYENKESILSPVDGKIIAIDTIDDAIKIYCKVSLLDNHRVRAPFSGELIVEKYHKGLNLDPNTFKSKLLNEQIVYKFISDDKKVNLQLKLLSGFCNIGIEKNENRTISQGDAITFFIDGIAIITVKKEIKLLVNMGDKLSSGQSILCKK